MNRFALLLVLASATSGAMAQATNPATKRVLDSTDQALATQLDVYFDGGDFPRTIELLRARYELAPTNYERATDLGWMLENVERWDQAIAVYARFRREATSDPNRALPEADFYFRKRLYPRVPALLEPAVGQPGVHPNLYRVLAHAYDRLGQFADSVRVWEVYLKIQPEDGAAKMNRDRVKAKIANPPKSK